jgi:hypothetical protein
MNWLILENNTKINSNDIPTVSIDDIKFDFKNMNLRLLGFFGKQEFENIRLYVVLSDDKIGKLYVTSTLFDKETKSYDSFTNIYPQFHIFEREFY